MQKSDIAATELTPLAKKEVSVVEIVSTPDKMIKFFLQLDKFYHDVLKEGTDYGTIPGTKKPTLYKSGAEALLIIFNLRAESTVVSQIEDYDKPFFDYTVKCTLYSNSDGLEKGTGLGSTNTGETRYCRRWDKKTNNWRESSKDEIFTLKNTVLKMAEKRALVNITLRVTNASRIFTQDVEDNPNLVGDDDDPAYSAPPPPKPTQTRSAGVTANVEMQRPISPARQSTVVSSLKEATRPADVPAAEPFTHRLTWNVETNDELKLNEPIFIGAANLDIGVRTLNNAFHNTTVPFLKVMSEDKQNMTSVLVGKMSDELSKTVVNALKYILIKHYGCNGKDVTIEMTAL